MKRHILAGVLLASSATAVEQRTALNGVATSDTAITSGSAVISDFTSVYSPATTIRVRCDVDARIELGVAAGVTPTGYVTRTTTLSGGSAEYFEFLERSKTSLRAVSSSGTCNLTKMGKGS